MEDAATAEISRAQIWQWNKYNVTLSNGRKVADEYLSQLIDSELEKYKESSRFDEPKDIFINLYFCPN